MTPPGVTTSRATEVTVALVTEVLDTLEPCDHLDGCGCCSDCTAWRVATALEDGAP